MNTSRPLTRRMADKKIAGVAAGLADYFAVDVTLIRVLFVVGTFFVGGIGVWLYILGWIVMPKDNRAVSQIRYSPVATGVFLAVLIAIIAGLAFIGHRGEWVAAGVFVALLVGVWLFLKKRNRTAIAPPQPQSWQEPTSEEAPPEYYNPTAFHIDSFYPNPSTTSIPDSTDNTSGFQRQ